MAANTISSIGSSASMEASRKNAKRIFDKYADGNGERPQGPFDYMDEASLCNNSIWEGFVYWLVYTYSSASGASNGKFLQSSSVINILSLLLNLARNRFLAIGSERTKLFFTCLDRQGTSVQAKWLKGIKININRIVFQRDKANGEDQDKSAPSIYLKQIEEMTGAFEKIGDKESMLRKFTLMSAFATAAKSSELRCVAYSGINYDYQFRAIVAKVPQSKNSEDKIGVYVAGARSTTCVFTAFGDRLACSPLPLPRADDEDRVQWVFNDLADVSSPGTKLGSYIKAFLPNATGKYSNYSVRSLPQNASAAGIRHCAANTLLSRMPADYAIKVTGHDLRGIFEYLKADIAMLMPGAIVLAGWPALDFGHLGQGSVHASISVLKDDLGVNADILKEMLRTLFYFDSTTMPDLKPGGSLYVISEAAFASIIMWYNQRHQDQKVSQLHQRIIDIYKTLFDCPPGAAHQALQRWSHALYEKFLADNLHLTGRWVRDDESNEVVDVMRELKREFSSLRSEVSSLRSEVRALKRQRTSSFSAPSEAVAITPAPTSTASISAIDDQEHSAPAQASDMIFGSPPQDQVVAEEFDSDDREQELIAPMVLESPSSDKHVEDNLTVRAAPVCAVPTLTAEVGSSQEEHLTLPPPSASDSDPPPQENENAAARAPTPTSGTLSPVWAQLFFQGANTQSGAIKVGDYDATTLYLAYYENQQSLPEFASRQDRSRANTVILWFDAFATLEEKSQFLDPDFDIGNKRLNILNLNRLARLYFRQKFTGLGKDVPHNLRLHRMSEPLRINTLSEILKKLKSYRRGNALYIDKSEIAAFRKGAPPRSPPRLTLS